MAKNYSEVYSAVYTKGNSMSFGNAMLRGNGVPLDITEVYDSYNKAVLYAAENAVAYEGQLLAVTENGDTTVYVITPKLQDTIAIDVAGDGITKDVPVYIKEVGAVPTADGNTIEVVDGVLRLVGLDGLDTAKTYQPVLVDGVIEWREPSAVTVEGLDTRLETAEGKITTLEGVVGGEEAGLVKDVATLRGEVDQAKLDIQALEDKAEDYKAADETLHTTISGEVATAIAEAVAEVKKYADDNDADTAYDDTKVKEDIQANATAIAGVKTTAEKAAADILGEVEAREAADEALESALKEYVGQEIGKQAHFSAKVVTSTEEMTDATTLYLMKTAETGDDMYEEWMLIEGTPAKIGTTATDLTDYAKTADVETSIANAKTDLQGSIKALEEAHAADKTALQTATEKVASDLAEFETEVGNTYETKEAVATKVGELQGAIDDANAEIAKKANATDVETSIKAVDDIAKAAQEKANANETEIGKLKTADQGFETRIGALEAVGAEKNVINGASSEFEINADRELVIKSIEQSKIAGLTEELNGLKDSKVNKVSSTYQGEVREWTLLSPEDQAKLAKLTLGDTGNLEVSGKVNANNVEGLAAYLTANRDSIGGLFSSADATKLAGIATGAQVNVIEKIKINGTELTVGADKSINIPFATNNTLGVVLSSDDENKISVKADGTMEVNNLNVNKLTQTDGDTLILNGGHA